MTVDRMVLVIAGAFILVSLALSQIHSPYWLYFTAFVGANLMQSGFTRWCLMAIILRKLGVRQGTTFG